MVSATEQENDRSCHLQKASISVLVDLFLQEEAESIQRLQVIKESLALFIEQIAVRFCKGGRIFYLGSGTSGRLGVLDAAELFPTFSLEKGRVIAVIAGGVEAISAAKEGAEDQCDGVLDGLQVTPLDTVIGISASGSTPFVCQGLQEAKQKGALTAMICASKPVVQTLDHVLVLPTGPEVIAGSTRLKAGTATKIVLNTLSSAIMIAEGRVMGNQMVDLQVSNAKLKKRAVRIVAKINNESEEKAKDRLEKADWQCRDALLSLEESVKKEFFGAIDAGGSKTRLLIFNEKKECVFEKIVKGTNGNQVSVVDLRAILYSLIADWQCDQLWVAAAGVEGNEHKWKQVLQELGYQDSNTEIVNDAEALLLLLHNEPGLVVVAGTGSAVFAKKGERIVQVGGLGPFLGDPGSGIAIGKKAVRAVLHARQGWGEKTCLEKMLPKSIHDQDLQQLASFAKGVILNSESDAVCKKIVTESAQELAELVLQAEKLLDLTKKNRVASGGIVQNPLFHAAFEEALGEKIILLSDPFLLASQQKMELLCSPA